MFSDVFQNVVDVLVDKTIQAAKEYGVKEIMLAGGVSANRGLREKMKRQVAMLDRRGIVSSTNEMLYQIMQ